MGMITTGLDKCPNSFKQDNEEGEKSLGYALSMHRYQMFPC